MTDLGVMLAAQGVAMAAMVGGVDPAAVDQMRTLAEELSCSQPLFRAITGFATQYELVRRDPAALKAEGEILRDAVIAAAAAARAPERILPERRDIDG